MCRLFTCTYLHMMLVLFSLHYITTVFAGAECVIMDANQKAVLVRRPFAVRKRIARAGLPWLK